MSLINFPDVPIAPGVPNLRRSAIGLSVIAGSSALGAVQRYDIFGMFDSLMAPEWGIYDKDDKEVITPDSFVMFEYRGERRICDYPVEMGSFSSYNKVSVPYDIRMVVACNGQGETSREVFLQTLELMMESTELYSIATPDAVYPGANLIRIDYRRTSRNGVSLLLADLLFQEVRVVETVTYSSTEEAAGAETTDEGNTNTTEPSTEQKSTIGKIGDSIKSGIKTVGGYVGKAVTQAESVFSQVGSYVGEIAQQGGSIISEVGGVATEMQNEFIKGAQSAIKGSV